MKKYFPVLQYVNVPNMITTTGLLFGIVACYYLAEGNLQAALVCLFLSTFMDLIDGFFAGKLKQRTRFGQYMDSLVDFFICCITPVWMVYAFVGNHFFLIVGLAFYCICGLWRLAYYNIIEADKYFTGLPVPGAMMSVTIAIWGVHIYGLPVWVAAATFFIIGLLMISGINLRKYGLWQKAVAGIGLVFMVVVVLSDV